VYIQAENRHFLTGTPVITSYAKVPPLSGYSAQIVLCYYDAPGNKLASQQCPFTAFDGPTNVTNTPFLGLPNQNWWVRTPGAVFPFWQRQGWTVVAQPAWFIDGYQAAVGYLVTL
jgi:hypothetical protein